MASSTTMPTIRVRPRSGELVVAEASPRDFRVLARARLLSGTVRAYAALTDGVIFVRNEKTLAAFDLRSN